MNFLKKIFGNNDKQAVDYTSQTQDDLPNLEAESIPTLANNDVPKTSRHANEMNEEFRGRENHVEVTTNELPSVNKAAGNNKMVTILGFIFIIGAAIALFSAANGNKKPKEKKQDVAEKITNTLPPLVIPQEPAKIELTTQTPDSSFKNVDYKPQGDTPSSNNTSAIGVRPNNTGNTGYANKRAIDVNGRPVLTATERKMGGELVVKSNTVNEAVMAKRDSTSQDNNRDDGNANSALGVSLQPTITKMASASMLPNRDFIITKGTPLDCALETALDSTLAGIATCILSRDAYSDNGKVLLMERGTKLVGEYDGKVKRGQVRLFLLWSRAKTPNGVVINLNSPSTDSLGRTGIEGWTDSHFAERFGSAILISLLSSTVQTIAQNQSQGSGGGTNIYGDSSKAGEKITESILKEQADIPTTILKNQGEHIEIMVARDLDFSSVYNLKGTE